MLQLDNITLSLGDRDLLDGISTIINPGDRVGLVGPNGAGKSTLLKIIMGIQEMDAGQISMAGSETLGYLPQDGVDPDFKLTAIEEVETAFKELFDLEMKVKSIQEQLARVDHDSKEYERLMEKYGELQTQLETSGLYTLRSEIEKVLMGLGFSEDDFNRSTSEFSGGWLMRIALAKLLLREPTYLLLDEPTNHLDIESLQWIEGFLKNYDGAVIVVSHDRAFLDILTTRTLAIRQGSMSDYAGNYSFYEKKWEEERELLVNAQKNQEKQIKETQEFIDRFRYKATKARQVQSRVKQLEKIDRIEVGDEFASVSFRFPPPERSGQVVMKLENITKRYGDNTVFEGLDYEIDRGDKIAVVGPNGAGKSTLIRILSGNEPIQAGVRKEGHNVTTSYFAQHQADELDLNADPLEVMMQAGSMEKESRLRSILGSFLFTGDDVFKKVKVLSGGEKSRLALAKMLLSPANFLIFDEPTNHLDMSSKNILQQAIQQYEGTCMIVSHDRSFLDPIVNKVLEIQPGRIRTYLGNVSYFLDKKKEEAEQVEEGQKIKNEVSSSSNLSRKEERRLEAERRNALNKKVRPIKLKLEKVEKEIETKEMRKAEIEELMAQTDFYDDNEKVKEVTLEYEELKKSLTDLMYQWEDYSNRIEAVESELS
ncbi:MAG: ABC-F family ATP-binding cassette domain-containing protein [Balneolaceae bacterium]|nr:ABC-F family ATP-binding cassette domain-containing protein [Balneolaceae bacterium]MBO6546034.1 ABC-F family ATP-binding cassette domain-containing protein [Balneolaceae bacterium]MBO6647430.1 ABC-F family ATP-binding cassette domain-containing protein [Balneolaceae bacterium]